MRKINHNELRKIIIQGYLRNVQLDIKGHPGIGKSQVVIQTAKHIAKLEDKEFYNWNSRNDEFDPEKHFMFADLRLHQMDPTGLLGIPDISGDHVEWKPIKLFKTLSDPKCDGILFFDEANLAQDSVLASAYSIIQDSQIGDLHISDGVMKISAGNLPEDGCNVTEEPPALNNRRMNYVLMEPNYNLWSDWARGNNIDHRIISYLGFNESGLYQFDEKLSDSAFPTPRTWEFLSNMIADESNLDTIKLYASGLVGENLAAGFVAYLKLDRKVNMKELLDDPSKLKIYSKERDFLGIKYTIIKNCIDLYEQKKNDNVEYLEKCMELGMKLEDELLVYMIRSFKFKYGQKFINCFNKIKNKELIKRVGNNIL